LARDRAWEGVSDALGAFTGDLSYCLILGMFALLMLMVVTLWVGK
jgi:hypothetical protein